MERLRQFSFSPKESLSKRAIRWHKEQDSRDNKLITCYAGSVSTSFDLLSLLIGVKLYLIVCNNLLSHWWKSPSVSVRPGLIPGYAPPLSVSMDSLPIVYRKEAVRVHTQRVVVVYAGLYSFLYFSLFLPLSELLQKGCSGVSSISRIFHLFLLLCMYVLKLTPLYFLFCISNK